MADMDPASLPSVFEGVSVPGGDVSSAQVVGVRPDGERAIGEAVYQTPAGAIGLGPAGSHAGPPGRPVRLRTLRPPPEARPPRCGFAPRPGPRRARTRPPGKPARTGARSCPPRPPRGVGCA